MALPLPQFPTLTEDSRRFFRLWDGWRAGRLLPRWGDVQLGSLGELLPRMALIEVLSRTEAPFRFIGSDIERNLGRPLLGANYIELVPPERRAWRGELLYREVSQPCAAANIYRLNYISGEMATVEVVSAPISADDTAGQPRLLVLVTGISEQAMSTGTAGDIDRVTPGAGEQLRFFDIGAGIASTRLH